MRLRAMVLQFDPEHGDIRWVDLVSRHKSHAAIVRALQAGMKRGEWIDWRLITASEQSIEQEENEQ